MPDTAAVIWRVVLAFVLAAAGGAISASIRPSHERLCALIGLAAGTLLGVTVFSILPETWSAKNWWATALAFGSGHFVFWCISRYVYHVCPACAASHFDEATTHLFSEIASGLVLALTIHSPMDGAALAAGHEAQGQGRPPAHAGGGFVFLASHAVFGELVKRRKVLASLAAGVRIIGTLNLAIRFL
ncbi:MAG TPA: hypothetical protein VL171_05420 [Verrucomicrobiae bacterium]|nr:hypothetical protein [Verrucomicrobiae bacterium]